MAGSRLVINSSSFREVEMQETLAKKFAACGIDPERLDIGYHSPPWDVMRKIEARGVIETAHRALESCSQICRYAVRIGQAERDPAQDLKGA